MTITEQILRRIEASPGSVWTAADFADLGSRTAVDKALQRLPIRRIDRGLYDYPTTNGITGQPNPPNPQKVIEAIARRDGLRILIDGMTAANDLGLTNAVPGRTIIHIETRLRPLLLGNATIEFRQTSPKKLYWAGRPAMRVVQAMLWLHDVRDQTEAATDLEAALSRVPNAEEIKEDLRQGLGTLPAWLRKIIARALSKQG